MKNLLVEIFAGMILSGLCLAQDTPPSAPPDNSATSAQQTQGQAAQHESHFRIAPGSVIPVQLTKTVDAKKAKTGDEVDATVTQDLKAASGEVVVPKDTKVVGHVTEAQPRGKDKDKDQKESEVGIVFDRAVTKDGSVSSLPMSIQAVIASQNQQNQAQPQNASNNSGGGMESAGSQGATGSSAGGRSAPMGAGASTQGAGSFPETANQENDQTSTDTPRNARRSITANTQGVVGISDYKLSSGDESKGSLVSSEKSNVKLESGTLLLLRVNQ